MINSFERRRPGERSLTDFNGPQFTPVPAPPRGPADYLPGHFGPGALMPHPPDDPGPPLVTPAGRLCALLLDLLLAVVTLGAGWLIWSLVAWRHGQTPAKQLMGHVVADATTGRPLGWGRMALRELVVRALLGTVLGLVTFGVYALADAFMACSAGHRTLHDRLAGSVVRCR
jgi:uncharacterized RDD family membrane protein YckC